LKGIIQKIGYDYDIDIIELEIPENHIHMVVHGMPKMSLSDVMQIIKSLSAREFFSKIPRNKKAIFLGRKKLTEILDHYIHKVILWKR